ncbi:hypothetical protein [Janibacter alittae]|uniref:Integral membrane protein n=1 Tax=Janibacter alittae TaxID=3115209 RepID=A0ABZ2MH60_9MICO
MVAAVFAGLVAEVLVTRSAGWWVHDVTTARIHFVVGGGVVGLAVGAAGAWLAPSMGWAAAVAGIILLGLYAPILPGSAPMLDAAVQLATAVVAAAVAVVLVGRRPGQRMT